MRPPALGVLPVVVLAGGVAAAAPLRSRHVPQSLGDPCSRRHLGLLGCGVGLVRHGVATAASRRYSRRRPAEPWPWRHGDLLRLLARTGTRQRPAGGPPWPRAPHARSSPGRAWPGCLGRVITADVNIVVAHCLVVHGARGRRGDERRDAEGVVFCWYCSRAIWPTCTWAESRRPGSADELVRRGQQDLGLRQRPRSPSLRCAAMRFCWATASAVCASARAIWRRLQLRWRRRGPPTTRPRLPLLPLGDRSSVGGCRRPPSRLRPRSRSRSSVLESAFAVSARPPLLWPRAWLRPAERRACGTSPSPRSPSWTSDAEIPPCRYQGRDY